MERRDGERSPVKEPIRKPWIWVVMVVITLAGIPWYLPKERIGIVLLGVPYWVLISGALVMLLCVYVSWLCFTQWDIIEAEEERGYANEVKDSSPEDGEE